MASYKGIEVKAEVRNLLPHMPLIEEYREVLQSLQAVWDNLNLLGQLSGTTAEIGQTREAFSALTSDLVNSLAEQTLAKCEQEMRAKAQVVIDILVRNLFERTADIGFLSTDDPIRDLVTELGSAGSLVSRFREYVEKYSVYEDVVLLSSSGKILARLDASAGSDQILQENWISESLQTNAPYVEYFGYTQLFQQQQNTLIYAYRVSGVADSKKGVLALCFRLTDELIRIFNNLAGQDDDFVLGLLDQQGRVIASSDPWQIPVGATLGVSQGAPHRIKFAGRNYLAIACESKGYQGYMGPGWLGLALVPLDQAFKVEGGSNTEIDIPASALYSVLKGGRAFSQDLQVIPVKADSIQQNLSRSIWNGTVRQAGHQSSTASNSSFSKILLGEISRVGMRMREVFSDSIGNLQTTVLSSQLADARFLAALAIDIMDRNLYERANDCRWWALDSNLQRCLQVSSEAQRQSGLEKILSYINGLYTVYDNLLVFDSEGKVLAVSNGEYSSFVGEVLTTAWVAECLELRNSRDYVVSPFELTPLYRDSCSYIYSAPILSEKDQDCLGGIGIVFDSTPQFSAMLQDVLPKNSSGDTVEGSFAVFIEPSGRVIASSVGDVNVGDVLDLPDDLRNPPQEGLSSFQVISGQVMIVGSKPSLGYREYKSSTSRYQNAVIALVFIPMGEYQEDGMLSQLKSAPQDARPKSTGNSDTPMLDIASFWVGDHWLGLPGFSVEEAISLEGATRLPNAPKQILGALIYRNETLPLYNLHAVLGLTEPAHEKELTVIVVHGQNGGYLGIIVDRLDEVFEVPVADIGDLTSVYVGVAPVLASMVKSAGTKNNRMLTLLSVTNMSEQLLT